ncbi:MAG: hypothetical protein KGL39_51465 [Patescibacteria group bacterium]|nr:hypothetical protein [Patescibacteria group bacterium]
MEIDRNLNLVLPVVRADGVTCYVHAQPIGHRVFKDNYLVIAKTFSAIYSEGLHVIGGPRIAGMMIRDVAANLGVAEKVELSLLAEIRRLANVCLPGPHGWETIPLEEAVRKQVLTAEDSDEVEGVLCFFTLAWSMHSRREVKEILSTVAGLWSGQITSSTLMEYVVSLQTSTRDEPTGETATALSIPH